MNNLIYLIIGLVIVLILALVLLRSRKSAPPPRQPAKVAPPRPSHERARQAAPVAAPNYQDRLNTAQHFIDQQRYDDAISELKQGLISQPQNKELTLKLLNIYALTNRHGPFLDLYQSPQVQGDMATLAAANDIKSLLDAEQASLRATAATTASVAAAEASPVISDTFDTKPDNDDLSLDFDYSADSATKAPQSQENDFSFDDLENQLLAEVTPTTKEGQITQATDTPDEGLAFTIEDSDDSGLSLETESEAQPEAKESDFSFSLEEPEEPEHPAPQSTAAAETDPFSLSDDFDLTQDTEVTDSSATKNAVPESSTDFLELEDLILEESSDALELELADAAESTQPAEFDAGDLEVNELSFADIENNELRTDDSLVFDSINTPSAAPEDSAITETTEVVNAQSADSQDPDLEDFDLDNLTLAETAPTKTLTEATEVTEPTEATESQPTELVTENPTPTVARPASSIDDSQFASDFNYVNELDGVQVTIDLAAQYLELGEYESAKRLLKEVSNQGTAEQQSQIESLLAKAA